MDTIQIKMANKIMSNEAGHISILLKERWPDTGMRPPTIFPYTTLTTLVLPKDKRVIDELIADCDNEYEMIGEERSIEHHITPRTRKEDILMIKKERHDMKNMMTAYRALKKLLIAARGSLK